LKKAKIAGIKAKYERWRAWKLANAEVVMGEALQAEKLDEEEKKEIMGVEEVRHPV